MKKYNFKDLTVYNSIFEFLDSNMYIILENNSALVVDPHKNEEVNDLLVQNNVNEVIIILTHEHSDHISGVRWLKENFNAKVISTDFCSNYMNDERQNRPILISFILEDRDRNEGTNLLERFNNVYKPFISPADITFEDELEYKFHSHCIKFKKIIGHTNGSCCVILDDKYIFTGDSLMKDYPIITRFPGGSKKSYINLTLPYLTSLDENLIVFPGHGEKFELKEVIKDGKLSVEFR